MEEFIKYITEKLDEKDKTILELMLKIQRLELTIEDLKKDIEKMQENEVNRYE